MNKVLYNVVYGVSSGAVKCLTVGNEVSTEGFRVGLTPVPLPPLPRIWDALLGSFPSSQPGEEHIGKQRWHD